jgi:hypothetical protein
LRSFFETYFFSNAFSAWIRSARPALALAKSLWKENRRMTTGKTTQLSRGITVCVQWETQGQRGRTAHLRRRWQEWGQTLSATMQAEHRALRAKWHNVAQAVPSPRERQSRKQKAFEYLRESLWWET